MPALPLMTASYLNAAQMSNVTIVLIYAAVLVIITSMINLRTNDPDPMLAGRNMPWWLVAGSIVGTSISSIAFLAIPTKGFALDFNVLSGMVISDFVGVPITLIFFIKSLRQSRNASIYTLIGDRFGKWSSTYASVAFIAWSTIRTGVITCLVAQGLHLICGIDVLNVMLLIGAIVIFYTYMSGIEGVIWTDFFQTAFLLIAGIASVVFLLNVIPSAKTDPILAIKSSPLVLEKINFFGDQNLALLLTTWLYFIFDTVSFYSSNQGIAQRYLVAKSTAHAKWGLAVGGMLAPLMVILFFSIGVLLFVFNLVQEDAPLVVAGSIDNIFGHFIADHFPDGLKGLAIIGILAAAMSTIDTGINSSSTVLICNLYEPYAKASGHRKSLLSMQVLRASSAFFGVAGICAAYCIYQSGQDILGFFWEMMGVINSGVLGLFILMRVSKKAGPKAAIIGVACGFAVSLCMVFSSGESFFWNSPIHFMLTLPISTLTTVLVGGFASLLVRNDSLNESFEGTAELSAKARQNLAKKRMRAKKNMFADSLRPKPFHRVYCGIAMGLGSIIFLEGDRIEFIDTDYNLLSAAMLCLALVVVLPFFIKNTVNKRYITLHLILLGIALPFLGAMALFSHPAEHAFGYFYLLTLAAMGTMVGWTMLGLATMITTAIAAQLSTYIYAHAGVPDNWAMIAVAALGIITYFAMEAAKENLVTERALARIHTIVAKIYSKVVDISVELLREKRAMNLDDINQVSKAAGEIKLMLGSLLGATDIDPEAAQLELSVAETLNHVKRRFSQKAQKAIEMAGGKDFKVLGNRDAFEGTLANILDNAVYYIERDEATQIVCTLNADKRTLTIANNGPTIEPKDIPYIYDLGYSGDKQSLGLGLTYAKRMLEAMRSGIRLISKPTDTWVEFRLYFPKYAELPAEAKMYPLQDAQ